MNRFVARELAALRQEIRALRDKTGDVQADKADAAQRAHVRVGHARSLELEPAVGIVRVPHAEIGADLGPGAFLHGPQHQPESVAVGLMQVLDEIIYLGR